eukprot:2533286-Rhodomonas_salina.1
MPWESMGICCSLGFGDDGDDLPDYLDKIHPQTVCAMEEQIHKISVCIDPAYHKPWNAGTCAPLFASSLSYRTTCIFFYFSLPCNPLVPGHCCHPTTTERKRQQDLSALQTQRFHLACNTIDSGGTASRVPAYPSSELEQWTTHLDSVSRACIHFECLHLKKMSSRADLRLAQPQSSLQGVQLRNKHSRLLTQPASATLNSSTAELPKFRIQDDLQLWLAAIESAHCDRSKQ